MQGINHIMAHERQVKDQEILDLKAQVQRLENRISNALGYLSAKHYQQSAITQAERELSLAMEGK